MKNFLIPVLLCLLLYPLPSPGQPALNQTDSAGLKQGPWQKRYPNGKLVYEGFFTDGKPSGLWKRYHDNGTIKAILGYQAPGDTASARLFDTNGKRVAEGLYLHELKTGRWSYFSNEVKIAEETYLEGKKEGLCSTYYKSGELLESSWWKDDQREGLYRAFYTTGIPYLECHYVNGTRNGKCISYYPSGKTEVESLYVNDLPEGPWKYFSEEGQLLYTLYYSEGKLLNPEVIRKLDSARLQELEKQRDRLTDPEKYLQNPEELLLRKP